MILLVTQPTIESIASTTIGTTVKTTYKVNIIDIEGYIKPLEVSKSYRVSGGNSQFLGGIIRTDDHMHTVLSNCLTESRIHDDLNTIDRYYQKHHKLPIHQLTSINWTVNPPSEVTNPIR